MSDYANYLDSLGQTDHAALIRRLDSFAPPEPRRRQRAEQPPRLREAEGSERCTSCLSFALVAGRGWKGEGTCSRYGGADVKADQVCDSWSSR